MITPTKANPVHVNDTNTIDIKVRLLLPLTPPPGVQQPAANKGWRATLSRSDFVNINGETETIRYTFPILRLRPDKDDVYRIVIETPPWLVDGLYDLTVHGPGFDAASPRAVRKGNQNLSIPKVTDISTVLIAEETPHPVLVPLVIPKAVWGVRVMHRQSKLKPHAIVPARLPDTGSRVAFFKLDAGPTRSLRIEALKKTGDCDTSFEWQTLGPNETLAWRNLAVKSSDSLVNTIWDFGDGRQGTGALVRHRFLLHNRAKVTVRTYNADGVTCVSQQELALNPLKMSGGCGCMLVGR